MPEHDWHQYYDPDKTRRLGRCDCCNYITNIQTWRAGPPEPMYENLCDLCANTLIANQVRHRSTPDATLYKTIGYLSNLLVDTFQVRTQLETTLGQQDDLDMTLEEDDPVEYIRKLLTPEKK